MKERLIYSPKTQKVGNYFDINFKKSPQKFVMYDSPQAPPQLPEPQHKQYQRLPNEFEKLKKLSDQVSSLRQTMNSKKVKNLMKRHTINDLQQQDEKPNKLNQFLRNTMSFRSTKAFSQKYASELANSNEVTLKKDDIYNTYRNLKNQDSNKITESKSAVNILEGKKGMDEYEMLNQKIDRNKKLIQELRRPQDREKNFLKNVNHNKSPTFLDLEREKQTDDKGFRKKKREQSGNFMTPKPSKGTYDARFNYNSQAQIAGKTQHTKEPVVSSMATISPVKRKASLNYVPKEHTMMDEFQIGKKLGEGKFGCVNIVRHKKTLGLFALKKIPKTMIKSHMMVDQLSLQIRLQSCLNHPNILGMYGFFDDKTHLYIVLEYMDGGTLYEKLKKGKLSEKEAATIVRQITKSIDYLHDMGIAHRDLKPQNIVISNNVHKLCDFGWATMCNERRKTYCGTFDYVAPEILQGVEYDMTVDLWCLGVMTFELMTGKAPFYHISRKQTMKRIMNVENETIQYPESMSNEAKDFIDKLIRKNPVERIKASQALLHPFIKDADSD